MAKKKTFLGMDFSWRGIRKGLGGIKRNMIKNYGVGGSTARRRSRRRSW